MIIPTYETKEDLLEDMAVFVELKRAYVREDRAYFIYEEGITRKVDIESVEGNKITEEWLEIFRRSQE